MTTLNKKFVNQKDATSVMYATNHLRILATYTYTREHIQEKNHFSVLTVQKDFTAMSFRCGISAQYTATVLTSVNYVIKVLQVLSFLRITNLTLMDLKSRMSRHVSSVNIASK